MKKILLIASSISIGGAERIAINTYNCLKDNYDVTLLVQGRKTVEYPFKGKLIDVQTPKRKTIVGRALNKILRNLKVIRHRNRIKPDYVISFGASSNILNVNSGMFSKGKTITAIHGFGEVEKSTRLRKILRHSDKVICISKAMQNGVLKLYPKAKNTVVIENGYEIDEIISRSIEKSDVIISKQYIMLMGRLAPVKRFNIAIKAFASIEKRYPDINLLVLGQGDEHDKLAALCKELNIEEKVDFLGIKSNPFVYLKEAKLFVLSSRTEGFPNALIEALACGAPIVAVDCESGPREILSEHFSPAPIRGKIFEKHGALVEQSNDEDAVALRLSEAMSELLYNEKLSNQYRINGPLRAKDFDQSVYREKVISLLNSIN